MANEQNRVAVLQRLHRHGPQSRAVLTRETGWNRSTVAAVVADLVERGVVVEDAPDVTRQVGRPSPVVRPAPHVHALGVLTEVDAVTVTAVDLGGEVGPAERTALAGDLRPETTVAAVVASLRRLRTERGADSCPSGIGVAVPGLVRTEDGLVRWAPHLGWRDVPLAAMLAGATGLAVRVANDANLGAQAEHLFGAARGSDHVVYLNGGPSGIGGGVIVAGQLVLGAHGYAGELGHQVVGERDLEEVVSRQRLLDVLGLAAASETELETALHTSRDPAVAAEVAHQLGLLALAVRGTVNTLNPERVVLGGFLGSMLARQPEAFQERLAVGVIDPSWEPGRVVRAGLGADLLLVGAAELVLAEVVARAEAGPLPH